LLDDGFTTSYGGLLEGYGLLNSREREIDGQIGHSVKNQFILEISEAQVTI
jgi:hypothetical protein